MSAWGNRNFCQRLLLLWSIFTGCIITACLVSNLVSCIIASRDTWFVLCRDCAPPKGVGEEDCTLCCTACTGEDKALFYIMRSYCFLFCILGLLAEVKPITWFFDHLKVFKYYWGRGLLHMFIGFFTVNANAAQQDMDKALHADITGYCLVGVGAVHVFLAVTCFKEYIDDEETSPTNTYNGPQQTKPTSNPNAI